MTSPEITSLTQARLQRRSEEANSLAPVVSWADFWTYKFDWKQGEHTAVIGPTGSGKTVLSMALLPRRTYVAAFATKPRDKTMNALKASDKFVQIKEWRSMPPRLYPKRILWPPAKSLYSVGQQRKEFRRAMEKIYLEGGWCVYIDELWFFIHHLKMEFEVRTYLLQARSMGISLMAATQRPAYVPLEIYDQSTHLFFYKDSDERNLKRISGIAWLSAKSVQHLVANLDRHQFLYINTRTGEMLRSKVEIKKGG